MKKLILSTIALAALTFVACKKDNLQPTINSTNIEQQNIETVDDDKVVDARTKFVGSWSGTSISSTQLYGSSIAGRVLFFSVSKTSNSKLKIVIQDLDGDADVFTAKVSTTNKSIINSTTGPVKKTVKGVKNTNGTITFTFTEKVDGVTKRYVIKAGKQTGSGF